MASSQPPFRGFNTYLPKPKEKVDTPECQVVQLLLDRQDKGGNESYLIQVLLRGQPTRSHFWKNEKGKVIIDFYNTGKPAMRLTKIRGGIIEASQIEEFYYREKDSQHAEFFHTRRMLRLTLFTEETLDLKFRDTLDRILIVFSVKKK